MVTLAPDRQIHLLVSVDTEEDQWGPSDEEVTVRNILLLPGLQDFFCDLGIRPTYFTSYQVAIASDSSAVMREIAAREGVEIGAHLHPWNTPPHLEGDAPRDSMLVNLPRSLQEAKLRHLTEALRVGVGVDPVSFRAGRLAVGPETIKALAATGYEIDSSVVPCMDLRAMDDGPDFRGLPHRPYRLGGDGDLSGDPNGTLLEIPLSAGFTRGDTRFWSRIHGLLTPIGLRGHSVWGLISLSGLVRHVVLSPEFDSAEDMLDLARALVKEGVDHLHISIHSSSLVPGLTPFTSSIGEVDRVLGRLVDFVEGLRAEFPTVSSTVEELGRGMVKGTVA
ncbi:MAG: hypothetical protein RQ745_04310 [Longimicrobiales bacterium]|nr:hypothetical protein [Longimicrobiales bacterium]